MRRFSYLLTLWAIISWLMTTPSLQAAPLAATTCNTTTKTDQIYRATSLDGLTFTASNTLLLNQAAAPAALQVEGQIWLYFVNTGIGLAQQNHEGRFETAGCITLDGVTQLQARDPAVIRLNDGRYRLFYTLESDPRTILSAVSDDGLHFTVEGATLTADQATHPTVVQLASGSWLLAYQAGSKIAFAVSQNGLDFTPNQSAVEVTGQSPALMALADGRVRLVVGGSTLVSFISRDEGMVWQKEQPGITLNQAKTGVYEPALMPMPDQSWMLFYRVQGQTEAGDTLSGTVLLQGRTDSSGIEIYLSNASCDTQGADTLKTQTPNNGHFELQIPAGRSYPCLTARKPAYLSAQITNPVGHVGEITLLGGDVNGDNLINIFDLALIAAQYDGRDSTVDVNDDKIVDIFDLTITAINYNKRGPISNE